VVAAYFLDSSALVKRYVNETGSIWVQAITAPQTGNKLIIARITWVEVLSALARLQREGNLPPTNVTKAVQAFQYHLDTQYQVVELDRPLAQAAGQLVQRHPLRAYDSVQLASALKLQPAFARATSASLTFVSADNRLTSVAQTEGLLTDNPNNYP
jgi:predicted nucleic acid-binding protein